MRDRLYGSSKVKMTQFCRLNGRDDGGGIKWKEGIQESEWFGG